jgi:hypothetical protein
MPKDIDSADLLYFYKSGVTALTGYKFSIDAEDDTKFIANTVQVGSYTAMAIKRNPIRSEEGTIMNELEIGLDHVDLSLKNDIMSGKYNNKRVKVYLVFPVWSGSQWNVGSEVLLFYGWTDEPKGDEHWITVSVIPFPYIDRQYPKRIYQSGCNWTFCHPNTCNLSLSTYTTNVNLSAQSDGVTLTCSHGKAIDYFFPGYVQIKNGALVGAVRPVLQNDTTTVTVRIPFDDIIESGVNIDIVKLCAKNYETCEDDFNNYSEYGGFPWVPKEPIL